MKKFLNLINKAIALRETAIVDDDFPRVLNEFDGALDYCRVDYSRLKDLKIICLCGSTRFKTEYDDYNYKFTMQGFIVLSVGHFRNAEYHGGTICVTVDEKNKLDELHKRKIDLADQVFIINKNNYIGESTKSEIEYAKNLGKQITYMEF